MALEISDSDDELVGPPPMCIDSDDDMVLHEPVDSDDEWEEDEATAAVLDHYVWGVTDVGSEVSTAPSTPRGTSGARSAPITSCGEGGVQPKRSNA